jgi:hypothetical protein
MDPAPVGTQRFTDGMHAIQNFCFRTRHRS